MIAVFFLSLIAGVVLTGLIRKYAIARSVLDIPNERSSHTQPVPRGGGLAIVVVIQTVVLIAGWMDLLERTELWALIGGGCLVAAIGWIDDHRDVSALFRGVVHLIAAIWTLYWLNGLGSINLGIVTFDSGWSGTLLAIVATVWMINLYNFMDGTDGIASVQAILAGGFAAFLFIAANNQGYAWITLALTGVCLGFLYWNRAPAKIFMGDVGSSFLGYFFAALAVMGEQSESAPLLIWSMLLSVFFWDATLTLTRRYRKGEKWYAAHRSHAYQRFVQMGNSHGKLAFHIVILYLCVVWPLAFLVSNYQSAMLVIAIAVAGLVIKMWFMVQNKYDKDN